MRVFRAELLDALELNAHGMEFASEMIMQASAAGLTIEEVPITYHERAGEATLETFSDGWRHVRFMLVNAPSYLFAGPGAGLGTLGVVVMVLSLLGIEAGGVTFGDYTMIAGSLLVAAGYQVGALSVFTTVVTDPIRGQHDVVTRLIQKRFTLEVGVGTGVAVLAAGCALAAALVGAWATGLEVTPPITLAIVAMTAVVLGLQTVFYSFFLSMLAGLTPAPPAIGVDPDESVTAPEPTSDVHLHLPEEAD
jgi:hypothetical protein